MSESGTLFNSGFLGAHFNWWIGQIADDSTWRDNIIPGKFESKDQIPGWGRRYKVRIIGFHDKEEESIPSDQLPWAQVMYPVTAGGGQAAASQTANLRQGMFVFGFFLDGPEGQNPVIMGILGNNAQTALNTKTGSTDTNYSAQSGFATGKDKDPNIKVPDEALVVNKPKSPEQSAECAPVPNGVAVNQFGLRADRSLSREQFADQQSARAEADARGLTGTQRTEFIQRAVSQGIKNRCEQANSPNSPSRPGATKENADAVHELSVADVKRNEVYLRRSHMMSPCDPVGSALKAIQVILDNLTKDINKILETARSYIDAASNILRDIRSLISKASCELAKYIKIIFDKLLEYILKLVNKSLAPTINSLFPNQRFKLLDLKDQITELINCIFSKIINKLCDQINGFLNGEIDRQSLTPTDRTPKVQMCTVENITGTLISANLNEINSEVSKALKVIDDFLQDSLDVLKQVDSVLASAVSIPNIGNLAGNITSALNFSNISFTLFGCDFKPRCAISDFYTLQNGSGATEDVEQPRITAVDRSAQQPVTPPTVTTTPFATPSKSEPDVNFGRAEAIEAINSGAVVVA